MMDIRSRRTAGGPFRTSSELLSATLLCSSPPIRWRPTRAFSSPIRSLVRRLINFYHFLLFHFANWQHGYILLGCQQASSAFND